MAWIHCLFVLIIIKLLITPEQILNKAVGQYLSVRLEIKSLQETLFWLIFVVNVFNFSSLWRQNNVRSIDRTNILAKFGDSPRFFTVKGNN